MRSLFPGYYLRSEDELSSLWSTAIFAFDANMLLNMYRYSEKSRHDFLSILKSDELRDRIWLPHQAAAEYHKNKLDVICGQHAAYKRLQDSLDAAMNDLTGQFMSHKKHAVLDVSDILAKIRGHIEELKSHIAETARANVLPGSLVNDAIGDELASLFEGRVGGEYARDELEKFQKEADARYPAKIPPGYKDGNKPDKGYGDYILWKQLIDKAKDTKLPIVFVTDDAKEDWWWRQDGKTVGPRPELTQELLRLAGVGFHMYQADSFLLYAKRTLAKPIEQVTIDEVTEVRTRIAEEDAQAAEAQQVAEVLSRLAKPDNGGEGAVSSSNAASSLVDAVHGQARQIEVVGRTFTFQDAFPGLYEKGLRRQDGSINWIRFLLETAGVVAKAVLMQRGMLPIDVPGAVQSSVSKVVAPGAPSGIVVTPIFTEAPAMPHAPTFAPPKVDAADAINPAAVNDPEPKGDPPQS